MSRNVNNMILTANQEICEYWSKLKTIRDDRQTPNVYARWCDQVMDYLSRVESAFEDINEN